MIRQAISCDICGTEMLNANHWFVANDRGPELRISAWSARNRTRAGVRHLCGHKCLHKLVDDFMAKTLSARASCIRPSRNRRRSLRAVQRHNSRMERTAPDASASHHRLKH